MNNDDLLQAFYEEHLTQARQHETLRERVTAIAGTLASALLALAASNIAAVDAHRPILGWILVGIGCFGALASYKHYERNRFHVAVAGESRRELEKLLNVPETSSPSGIRGRVERTHNQKYPVMHRVRLFALWLLMHGILIAAGLFIALS